MIKNDNVFYRINKDFYRLPTKNLLQTFILLKSELTQININKNVNKQNNYYEYIKTLEYQIEKINKIINFLWCFHLKTLQKTFFKCYFMSSEYGKEMTNCKKNFYLLNDNTNPYYTTSELIN